jgi:hypothetical protein
MAELLKTLVEFETIFRNEISESHSNFGIHKI